MVCGGVFVKKPKEDIPPEKKPDDSKEATAEPVPDGEPVSDVAEGQPVTVPTSVAAVDTEAAAAPAAAFRLAMKMRVKARRVMIQPLAARSLRATPQRAAMMQAQPLQRPRRRSRRRRPPGARAW